MKDKILIGLVVVLVFALFIETAYILQLKSEKALNSITKKYKPKVKRFQRSYNFERQNNDLFRELDSLQKEMDTVFQDGFLFKYDFDNNFFNKPLLQPFKNNLQENENEYIVKFYLPGMEKSKINIEIKNNSLIVSGEQNIKKSNQQSFSSFKKVIPIPGDIKVNEVQTEYKDGLLVITLPKDSSSELTKQNNSRIKV